MRITVEKLTNERLLREANEFTMNHRRTSTQTLDSAYEHRHSPIRTQIFVVRMYGIPTATSVHLVRHAAVGQQHYVGSNRADLGGDDNANRHTPVDHMMILNAQHLEEMAWDRLCRKSSEETQFVLKLIRQAVKEVDQELAKKMVPRCLFLNRCIEAKPCKKL